MTLPLLPTSSKIEEKWQSPPYSSRPRPRLFSTYILSHLSLSHNFPKYVLQILPLVFLFFTLGYILTDQISQSSQVPSCQPFPNIEIPLINPPTIPSIPILENIPDPNVPLANGSHPKSSSHPCILIFQHFAFNDERVYHLQNESIASHDRYASYWGYKYIRSFDQYVTTEGVTTRQRQMNKLYALLEVVLREVTLGEKGAEWIMITDADTLIVNPLVPIHSLLPPSDLNSDNPPLIVGTEDGNGFNSGVMILRSGIDLVAFISRAIVLSDNVTWDYDHRPDYYSSTSNSRGEEEEQEEEEEKEEPPSDQRALCLTLQSDPVTASRYYPYPQEWLNSYWLPSAEQDMVLQIHLVAGGKYTEDLSPWLDSGRLAWEVLKGMNTQQVEERAEAIRRRAKIYWEGVEVGAPKCTWQ